MSTTTHTETDVVTDRRLAEGESPHLLRGLLATLLVALVAAGAVLAVRWSAHESSSPPAGVAAPAGGSLDAAAEPVVYVPPSSPQIEQTWGIRIVGVQVAASRGLVLLRYQVLDEDKGGRLHDSDNSGVPEIWSEDASGHIDTVVMGHNHYYGNGQVDGRTFVMIYGNAGRLLDAGEYVTIRMADGQQLEHVLVQT